MSLLQPIDGPYFLTSYFWVSLGISIVLGLLSVVVGRKKKPDSWHDSGL